MGKVIFTTGNREILHEQFQPIFGLWFLLVTNDLNYLFPYKNPCTDFVSLALCGWLKSNWIVLSEGGSEIREDAAFSFGQSLVPQMPRDILQSHLDVS